MSARIISNAGGNWTDTAAWVEGVVPTSADDVSATGTSGNLTLTDEATCRDIDLSLYASGKVLTHPAAVDFNVHGSIDFSGAWAYTKGSTTTARLNLLATATGKTVKSGGKVFGNTLVNGVGGGWTQLDAFAANGAAGGGTSFTLTNGSWLTGNFSFSVGTFSSSNLNTRSLNLGSSVVAVGIWQTSVITNFTFTPGTSTVAFSNTPLNTGGLSFNHGTWSSGAIREMTGSPSFNSFIYTGGPNKNAQMRLGGDLTCTPGQFLATGNSITNRVKVDSTVPGVQRTITAAVVGACTNCDFQDIVGAGAGSWDLSAIAGKSGDCGGNSGITFTIRQTNYWVGGTDNWETLAKWASTSGGSASSGRVPLPQDDVVFDANSFSTGSQVVTATMPRLGRHVTWENATNAPTWALSSTPNTVYGTVTVIDAMTRSGTQPFTFAGRGEDGLFNADANPFTWPTAVSVSKPGAKLDTATEVGITFASTVSVASGGLHFRGDVSCVSLNVVAGATLHRAGEIGDEVLVTLTGTGTVLSVSPTAIVEGDGFIHFAVINVSATAKTIAGGDHDYGELRVTAGGAGAVTVTGDNSWWSWDRVGTGTKTVRVAADSTQELTGLLGGTDLFFSGTSGNLWTVESTVAGVSFGLVSDSRVITDFVSLKDNAASGASFYAGNGSTNVSGNSGWTFTGYAGTGTGILTAQAATVAGTASQSPPTRSGTGTLIVVAASVVGAGVRTPAEKSGAGALAAAIATVIGTGAQTPQERSGTGTLAVAIATATGTGAQTPQERVAAGSLLAAASVLSGAAGHSGARDGTGSLITGAAIMTGVGDRETEARSGSGTLSATAATLAGSAQQMAAERNGAGTLLVIAAALAGAGQRAAQERAGSGVLTVTPSLLIGVAQQTAQAREATGSLAASAPVLAGSGGLFAVVRRGSGQCAARSASCAGLGAHVQPTRSCAVSQASGPLTCSGVALHVARATGVGALAARLPVVTWRTRPIRVSARTRRARLAGSQDARAALLGSLGGRDRVGGSAGDVRARWSGAGEEYA